MQKYLIRTSQLVFFGFAAIFAVYMAANMLVLSWPTLSLPTSDYLSVFKRYIDFTNGKIDFYTFVLSKHVDHNHAFGYLLSFIDITVDDGKLRLLHAVQLAAHTAVFGLLIYVAYKLDLPIGVKGVVLAFIASQIFAVQSAETFVFPFQVVLASFRLFLIVGLLLLCREIVGSPLPRQKIVLGALLILFVASLSHGSGILIFALVFLLVSIWGNRKTMYVSVGFFSLFVLHEIIFKSSSSMIELITRIPATELLKTPYYLAFLLGNSFAWGAVEKFQVVVGIVGIVTWVALLHHIYVKRSREVSPYNVFFFTLSTFSLMGGALSILLNLSYMEFRSVAIPPPSEYFLSSRYLILTGGFWIGIATVSLTYCNSWKRLILSICLVSSSVMAVLQGENQKEFWQQFIGRSKINEMVFSTNLWETLPQSNIEEMLLVPANFPFLDVVQAQKRLKLGPYAPGLANENRQYALQSPLGLTDVNWSRGIAKGWAGFFVLNIPENRLRLIPGSQIRFADGGVRKIINQIESGIYLNITLEGSPLVGEKVGYPNKFEVENE